MKLTSKKIIYSLKPIKVYDITVPVTENFYLAAGNVVHNSKDIMDSVVRTVCTALEAGKEAADVPKQYAAKKYSELVEKTRLSRERKDYLKNPLERRNFWG